MTPTRHAKKRRLILYGITQNTYHCMDAALHYARTHHWTLCLDAALTWTIPLRWRGDGIIAFLSEGSALTDYVLSRPEPKVFITSAMPQVRGPRVIHDNRLAGHLAAEYFMGLGFSHYAFVKLRDMHFNAGQITGFRETLEKRGFTCQILEFTSPANRCKKPETWLRHLLHDLPKPVAIFAADDVLATDLVHVALEAGIRVPDDVAILGTPNIPEIVTASPVPVSSVEMDEEGVIFRACELLDAILDGERPPGQPICVPPRGIVERASTNVVVFGDRLVREAMEMMRTQIDRPIGIEQIADDLGVDRRQLSAAFRRSVGHSPHEVLLAERLRKVKELLTETPLTLPDIARQTGFTTHQYLCRFFREATNMTPSAYRRTRSRRIHPTSRQTVT